jgi:hypothetical protein
MLYLPSTNSPGCCSNTSKETLLAAVQTRLKKVAPGTPPVAQRLLTIAMPKHGPHMHIHANNDKR